MEEGMKYISIVHFMKNNRATPATKCKWFYTLIYSSDAMININKGSYVQYNELFKLSSINGRCIVEEKSSSPSSLSLK